MKRRHAAAIILLIIILLLVLLAPILLPPRQGHLTLLTVVGPEEGVRRGGTADLYLELEPGDGDVYIATFPFAKVDTQISTRFAKEVACSLVETRCDRYDFYYTIKADSTIIGGPSAGAAVATLTAAVLTGHDIDQDVAMTGTVNSGGVIGPVGGVQQKIRAAAQKGIGAVLVPRWDQDFPTAANATANMTGNVTGNTTANDTSSLITDPGTNKTNITVVEVGSVAEALSWFTGEDYFRGGDEVVTPPAYDDIMDRVAGRLCNRSRQIQSSLPGGVENTVLYNQSEGFLASADEAEADGLSYSRASYCFSANLRLRELQFRNESRERLEDMAVEVRGKVSDSLAWLQERHLTTFADLQTKAIVDERLREAQGYLEGDNFTAGEVAYAVERYNSAVVWSSFFELEGESLQLDDQHLRSVCESKIGHVEERKSYLFLLLGPLASFDETSLEEAYRFRDDGDYALCLFKASKAKAQLDMILSSMAVGDDDLSEMTKEKLRIARSVIAREHERGRFPLMGYSYYEYAGDLVHEDPYAAALFASYALELGDLSLYFEDRPAFLDRVGDVVRDPFFLGFVLGIVVMLLFLELWVGPSGSKGRKGKGGRQKKRTR